VVILWVRVTAARDRGPTRVWLVRGFLGCYTTRDSRSTGASGISLLDRNGPRLTVRPGPQAVNPTHLTLSADKRTLYAAVELKEGGAIAAFRWDGALLTPLGTPQLTGGTRSSYVSVHPAGYVLSADYGHGSLAVHPIGGDSALRERSDLVQLSGTGPNPQRQEAAHAHMILPTPDGQYVVAIDLGTDSIYRYRLEAGRLRQDAVASVEPGAGPRHLAFHPTLPYAYVANELDSTVTVLDRQAFATGATSSTVTSDQDGRSQPSAIRVSPDGRFCYVANRGVDSIAVLTIHPAGDSLELTSTVPCGGEHPRDMTLAGGYLFSANQFSNTITQFHIDPQTGVPRQVGEPVVTPAPSCLVLT
jgi:6-phosphogluconolactonase